MTKLKNIILVVVTILFPVFANSQSAYAYRNFEKGTDAVNLGNYLKGIKLLTLAIDEYPTSDAYFNRAAAYNSLGDTCSFCNDIKKAAEMNDWEAAELYEKACFRYDTIQSAPDSILEHFPEYKYTVVSSLKCKSETGYKYYNKNDECYLCLNETVPEFPGGDNGRMKFLRSNLQYPNAAKESGIQGIVSVTFIIDKTGEISEVKVLRGIGGGCDEEAVRVVKLMPNWKPATRKGKPISVQYNMNVTYKLGK
jgi:TonB family protein